MPRLCGHAGHVIRQKYALETYESEIAGWKAYEAKDYIPWLVRSHKCVSQLQVSGFLLKTKFIRIWGFLDVKLARAL